MWIKNRSVEGNIIDEWINKELEHRYTLTYDNNDDIYDITQYDDKNKISDIIFSTDFTHKAYYFMDKRIGL